MHSLPIMLRLNGRAVILIGEGEAAAAKRRLLERAGAIVTDDWAAKAPIAVVALEDADEAARIAAALKARGVIVNVVDQPALCDFTMPSIVDRDPLIVAVATGGASAGLAKIVRQRIDALLPPGIGALAAALGAARGAIRARWPDGRTRRAALDAALARGGPLDPLVPHDGNAVERWLSGAATPDISRLEAITLVSDNPDDLTLRDARLLGEADLIIHPPGLALAILNRARADATFSSDPATPHLRQGLTVLIRRANITPN